MKLALVAHLLAPAAGTELPAISADGKLIAYLFQDAEDFTGAPITTLVVWSTAGARLGAYSLGGETEHGAQKPAVLAAHEDAILRDANARLAGMTWRPLAFHPACGTDERVELDGTTLRYDMDKAQLLRDGKRVAVTFPAVGQRSYGGTGPCGGVRSLLGGFGGPAIGVAVLVPHASLGGDSCFGLPTAETALAITIK